MEGDQGRQREAALCDRHEDGSGFGLAGLWENWKDPSTNEWTRTFAVLTTNANELVADIHDRMPVILRPEDYDRSLGSEPDPRDLLRPFPAELMRMWAISTRVNSPDRELAVLGADRGRPKSGPGVGERSSQHLAHPGGQPGRGNCCVRWISMRS